MTLQQHIFRHSASLCHVMSNVNVLNVLFLSACVISIVFSPLNSRAASFSEMLSSLTKSPSSWDEGVDGMESEDDEKNPIPEKKPKWIKDRVEVSSEQLLNADGNWNVVEKGREYDPAQAHLNARKKVDTARRSKMNELAPHFKPDAKSGQDGKLRVLHIEPEDGVNYGVVEDTGDGGSFLGKVFPVFKSDAPDAQKVLKKPFIADISVEDKQEDIVIPKIKPVRHDGEKTILVGDVVIPPSIPARKKKSLVNGGLKSPVSVGNVIAAADLSDDNDTSVNVDKIVVPQRKPNVNSYNKVKPLGLKTVLASSPDEVESSLVSSGDVFIPIPDVKPRIKKVVLKNGVASNKRVFVKNLRSGMHPDKTRVVIEMSDVTEYKVTVDDLRNVLRVKLANTQWNISEHDKVKGSSLLGTYIAKKSGSGDVLLEIRLKEKVKIIGTMVLRPNSSSSHRIVVDLKVL